MELQGHGGYHPSHAQDLETGYRTQRPEGCHPTPAEVLETSGLSLANASKGGERGDGGRRPFQKGVGLRTKGAKGRKGEEEVDEPAAALLTDQIKMQDFSLVQKCQAAAG